jgi:hypothetical protein
MPVNEIGDPRAPRRAITADANIYRLAHQLFRPVFGGVSAHAAGPAVCVAAMRTRGTLTVQSRSQSGEERSGSSISRRSVLASPPFVRSMPYSSGSVVNSNG